MTAEPKTYRETLVARLWGWQESTLDLAAKRTMAEAATLIEELLSSKRDSQPTVPASKEQVGPVRACPFCGSTDLEVHHKPDPYPPSYPGGVYRIECGGCGTQGPFCEERKNVSTAWNRRAA